jgi:hypothetical protein
MFPVYIRGKRIKVPNRGLFTKAKEILAMADIDETRERAHQYAKSCQTPLAKVYQQLIKEGLL